MPGSIPDRWIQYEPYGRIIKDTKILPFKVPLKKEIVQSLAPGERFTPEVLLQEFPHLKCIVDLTNTKRYYDQEEFTMADVKYTKINVPGKVVPPSFCVDAFFVTMDDFLRDAGKDDIIGVHCTHGINRTGYLICRYLIEKLGWKYEDSLNAFKEARGYLIERHEYIIDLLVASRTCRKNANVPDNWRLSQFPDQERIDNSSRTFSSSWGPAPAYLAPRDRGLTDRGYSDLAPRDRGLRDLAPRDLSPRGREPRDLAPRDLSPRGREPRDLAPRDRGLRDLAPRDLSPRGRERRDLPPSDLAPRDRGYSDLAPRDRGYSDLAPRDRGYSDLAPRDRGLRDLAPRDLSPRGREPRDLAPRHLSPRGREPRDLAPRDISPRGGEPRDLAPRDRGPTDRGPTDRGPTDRGYSDLAPRDLPPRDRGPRDLPPRNETLFNHLSDRPRNLFLPRWADRGGIRYRQDRMERVPKRRIQNRPYDVRRYYGRR